MSLLSRAPLISVLLASSILLISGCGEDNGVRVPTSTYQSEPTPTPTPTPIITLEQTPSTADIEAAYLKQLRVSSVVSNLDDRTLVLLGENGCRLADNLPGSWGDAEDAMVAAPMSAEQVRAILSAANRHLCPGTS
jgi:hypothetical protein